MYFISFVTVSFGKKKIEFNYFRLACFRLGTLNVAGGGKSTHSPCQPVWGGFLTQNSFNFPRPIRNFTVKENIIGSAVSEIVSYRQKNTILYNKINLFGLKIFDFKCMSFGRS